MSMSSTTAPIAGAARAASRFGFVTDIIMAAGASGISASASCSVANFSNLYPAGANKNKPQIENRERSKLNQKKKEKKKEGPFG